MTDGQTVRKGQVIGYVGMSGRSTGAHLHYEVRIHDTPVNPYKYLRDVPNRLAARRGAEKVFDGGKPGLKPVTYLRALQN